MAGEPAAAQALLDLQKKYGPQYAQAARDSLQATDPTGFDLRDQFGSKLTKGTLNYVSGAIAKISPEAVAVKTPTGTIGVRGTQFVVKVDADQ